MAAIISLDIDKDDTEKALPENDSFMNVESSSYAYIDTYRLKLAAYEYTNNEYVKFYDYYLNKDTDTVWNEEFIAGDSCLTTKATIQGKQYRVSNLTATVESSKEIQVNVSDYSSYLTKNIILKLFVKDNEDTTYSLFKQNPFGQFIQVTGPKTPTGDLFDIDVSIESGIITFSSEQDFASVVSEYEMTLVSEKSESKVSKLVLFEEDELGDPYELWSIEFKDEQNNNLYIDLPLNMDLMAIVSRHEDQQTGE